MKNIHLIQTDKPSRLYEFGGQYHLQPKAQENFRSYHIYITNSEEIKEGDWCFYLNNLGGGNIVCQAYKHSEDKRMLFDNGKHNRKIGEGITPLMGECKKIILTTDQDLIADGVQAIDDEFLEWFVKNPSCEKVEVESNKCLVKRGNCDCSQMDIDCQCLGYKIIIPNEEQTKCYCGHTTYCDCGPEEPKQETIEEVAERLYPTTIDSFTDNGFDLSERERLIFINGAEYQAERMYSEEDMNEAFSQGWVTRERFDDLSPEIIYPKGLDYEEKQEYAFNLWFQKFKKK
jgi:hypothetical protein